MPECSLSGMTDDELADLRAHCLAMADGSAPLESTMFRVDARQMADVVAAEQRRRRTR